MKGRAYRCAVCRKEDYRGRIVRHYLREHVSEKNIPFRCELCRYVSEDRVQWDKHLKLKEHTEALKELDSEVEVEPRSFLIEAREKFDLKVSAFLDEKACIYELDKKTSEKVWKEKQKTCAADKENSSRKDSKKNPKKRSARDEEDSTKKVERVKTVESRSNRDVRASSGVSEEGMEAALEVIRSKVKQGKEDMLREIQLLLWTEKDGKELKQAEQSITQDEGDCSEKETRLVKETEVQRKEEVMKECAKLKDAVKGQSNNVKAECTKVRRWKEEEDTEMVEGQFDDAESEESEADASSSDESSSSEDESEDCESVVENDAVEKKDIVDLTQEVKVTPTVHHQFELKRPTKIQEVIELDGDERSKEGNLEKICTEESGKQTTKRKRQDNNDVPMKRKKGGDIGGAVKRKRDAYQIYQPLLAK